MVSAAEQDCGTAAEVQAITDLQRDINNIELALIDGLAANPSRAAKIGVVLGRYGPYYGTASLFALIDRIAESDRLSQAARGPGAIAAAAHNSWMRGKYEQAHTLATRALEHLDANSPDRYMANFTLAGILYWQGEFEESLPYLQEIDNNHASSTMARAGACAEMALRLAILGDETNAATQIERGTSLAVSSGSPTALAHAKAVSAGMNLMADPSYAIAQASASAELAQSCGARAVELMAHTAQISAQNIMGQHDEVLAALPRVLPDLRRHGGWSYLWIFLRAAGDSLAQLNHTDAAAYAILAATADAAAPPRGLYAELLHITKDDIRAQLNNPELWDRYAIEIAAESRSQRVDRMIGLVRAIRV